MTKRIIREQPQPIDPSRLKKQANTLQEVNLLRVASSEVKSFNEARDNHNVSDMQRHRERFQKIIDVMKSPMDERRENPRAVSFFKEKRALKP